MAAAVPLGAGNVTTAEKNASGNSITAPIPANTVAGDVLIAVFAADQALASSTNTPGWTKISAARSGGNREVGIYHAFTSAGIPEAPVILQGGGTNTRASLAIYRVTGASQTVRSVGTSAWSTALESTNTTGITIPSTGATEAGVTFVGTYNNANSTQGPTLAGSVTVNGQPAVTHLTAYGTGTPGSASSTNSAHFISSSPGPFTVAWGKSIANSNGLAVTIPAADQSGGGGNPDPEPEPEPVEHDDEPGAMIQIGHNNVTTAAVNQAGVQSISLPIPSRTRLGDTLVAVIGHSGVAASTVEAPWVLISNNRTGENRYLAVFARAVDSVVPSGTVLFSSTEANVRMAGMMFRLTGVGLDYLAAKGNWQVSEPATNRTGFVIPAASPAGNVSLTVMYANNGASLATPRFSVAGATEIAQVAAEAAGSAVTTIGAFRSTSAGEKTVTISPQAANAAGFQITFQSPQPRVPASWEARVVRNGQLVPATVAAVRSGGQFLSPSMVSWQPKDYTVDDLFSTDPFFIAHRGSGDNWPEHTMESYNNSTAYGVKAIEVSVSLTADNILICHHDLNFQKTAKDPRTVRSMTYQQILDEIRIDTRQWTGNSSTLAPPPLAKDVIDAFIDTHVIFIEDKGGDGATALLNLMDTYPRGKDKFVWKQWAGAGQWAAAKARGYKCWGYFMADIFARIPELAPNFDYLGIPHTASDQVVSDIVAQGNTRGQPVIMWEIHYRWMFERAKALGVKGMMTSNIPYVMTTSTWQFREDQWHTGKRPAGDLPHTTDASWSIQPEIDPADGGICRFNERASAAMTLGSMCPIGLNSYAIEWEMRYTGALPKLVDHAGFWFGHSTDRTHRSSVTSTEGGYHLLQRVNGSFDLYRHDVGASQGIPLATTQTAPPVLGQWMKFRIEVMPEWVTAKRLDGEGWSITSSDQLYRGQYFGLQKNFTAVAEEPLKPFEYRNVKVIPL